MKAGKLWLAIAAWLGVVTIAHAEPPRVVVSIKPIHSLAALVLDGVAVPELLVKGSNSPHTYTLKPSETRVLHEADVFIRIGEGVEPFTAKLVASLPGSVAVVTLMDTPDLLLLPRRQNAAFEEHSHEEHRDGHKGDEAGTDAHVWLDPENGVKLVQRLAQVLSKRFPPFASQIQRNAANAQAMLAALDKELEATTRSIKDKPFAVYHDAIQYFEHRYGLKAVGSILISPDVPASGKRLSDLRRQAASLNALCVFGEPQSDARLLATITEGTPMRSAVLDAEGLSLDPGPGLYAELLRKLARDMQSCLAR